MTYDETDQGQQAVIPGAERRAPVIEDRRTRAQRAQRGLEGLELFDPCARPGARPDLFGGE